MGIKQLARKRSAGGRGWFNFVDMGHLQGKNSAFFAEERSFWQKIKPIWLRLRESLNTYIDTFSLVESHRLNQAWVSCSRLIPYSASSLVMCMWIGLSPSAKPLSKKSALQTVPPALRQRCRKCAEKMRLSPGCSK